MNSDPHDENLDFVNPSYENGHFCPASNSENRLWVRTEPHRAIWPPKRPKLTPKWPQNDPQLSPKWPQKDQTLTWQLPKTDTSTEIMKHIEKHLPKQCKIMRKYRKLKNLHRNTEKPLKKNSSRNNEKPYKTLTETMKTCWKILTTTNGIIH